MKKPGVDIAKLFQKGNAKAFEYIYYQNFISLQHFACKFVIDFQVAEDITTETFLKLWKMHENFDNLSSINAFLHITARNACLNYLRSEKYKTEVEKSLSSALSGSHEEIENDNMEELVLKKIFEEIDKLPERTREVFIMAFIDGRKNGEIAESLNISYHTVKNQKQRALELIRIKFLNQSFTPALFILISSQILLAAAIARASGFFL